MAELRITRLLAEVVVSTAATTPSTGLSTDFLDVLAAGSWLAVRCAAESGRCKMTPKRTEDRAPAFDGTLMILIGAVTVRTWDVQTVPLDASEFNALLAALRATPIVTITGDWLAGATVSVWPKLGPITPISATADPQAMTFTFIEAV